MPATRTVYLTIKLDLFHPYLDEITDEDVDDVIEELNYGSCEADGFHVASEICEYTD